MDEFTKFLLSTMEQAAISGLCHDGQVEIVVQNARKLRPNLDRNELFQLAEEIYQLLQDSI
ncbi:MAG: hypothetical protein OEL79_01265 [Chromatiales bacterium]|nr:hypothetical protein [Chromatiales bacterium]